MFPQDNVRSHKILQDLKRNTSNRKALQTYFAIVFLFYSYSVCRLYVPGGECSMCKRTIPPNEKVMKFKNNLNYHVTCFQCVFCQYRFNVGDRVFIPKPNIILCSRHWMSDPSNDHHLENSSVEIESDVVKMIEIMS